MLNFIQKVRINRFNKTKASIKLTMMDKIEEIKKTALERHIPLEGLFEMKRLLNTNNDFPMHKLTIKKMKMMDMLLAELSYKIERRDVVSLKPYTNQIIDMIINLKQEKIETKKVEISKELGEKFIIDLSLNETSTRIASLTRDIANQLERSKTLSPSDHEYQIQSNQYSITKSQLKVQMDHLNRLLSTKKRRESYEMLQERSQYVQFVQDLVGASFEEAQELLNHVQSIEGDFDHQEQLWRDLYQSSDKNNEILFDDTLSKDIEAKYVAESISNVNTIINHNELPENAK